MKDGCAVIGSRKRGLRLGDAEGVDVENDLRIGKSPLDIRFDLIGDLLGKKRVVVLTLNNDFGQALAAGFKEAAPKFGVTIVKEYTFAMGDRQFGPLVASVKADQPFFCWWNSSRRRTWSSGASPAAAAAAYQNVARMAQAASSPGIVPAEAPGSSFSDFLSGAVKESITNIRQGEQAASAQVAGKANIVDVVNSVNSAELTLDTVVAVRDKVVAAYQSIMSMPI